MEHARRAHAVEALQLRGGDAGASGDDPPPVVRLHRVGPGGRGRGRLAGQAELVTRVEHGLQAQAVEPQQVGDGDAAGGRDPGEGVARAHGVHRRLLGVGLGGQTGEQQQGHRAAGQDGAQAAGADGVWDTADLGIGSDGWNTTGK